MAMWAIRLRRLMVGMGASDDQADEYVELMDGFVTTDYLDAQLAKLLNRILLAQIGIAGVIITAVALIVHL